VYHDGNGNVRDMKVKNIKKVMNFIISILFLLTSISCNAIFARRSEENIGKYILKNTPIGSSKDDVRKFIEKKGYEILLDFNNRHFLRGITLPENYPPEDYPRVYITGQKRPIGIGSSYIYVCIAESRLFPLVTESVMCTWIFDENGKLFLIDINKEYDSL
jgi:hypothetical protein